MKRLVLALIAALAPTIAPLHAAPPRGEGTDVTVRSLLTMMKDLAGSNYSLRLRVGMHIELTRQQSAFGTYIDDTLAEGRRRMPEDRRNRELIDQAKAAFHAGDTELAKTLMLQCSAAPGTCGGDLLAGLHSIPQDTVFQLRFINWELENGDFAAARRRLETADWKKGFRNTMIVRVASQHIAAGLRAEGMDILRMLPPDMTVESCIVHVGPIGSGAAFRKMACEGRVREALGQALALESVYSRIDALGTIAQGLAGMPEYSNEALFQ